jgi:hypothetical protein
MATATLAARPAPLLTALAGLVTLGIAIGPGRFGFTPLLPMKRQDAAVSVVVGGWLVLATYVGYLLGATRAAGHGLRRRRRRDRGGRPRVRRLYGPVALVELLHDLSIHDLIFVLILSNGPRSSNTSEA